MDRNMKQNDTFDKRSYPSDRIRRENHEYKPLRIKLPPNKNRNLISYETVFVHILSLIFEKV